MKNLYILILSFLPFSLFAQDLPSSFSDSLGVYGSVKKLRDENTELQKRLREQERKYQGKIENIQKNHQLKQKEKDEQISSYKDLANGYRDLSEKRKEFIEDMRKGYIEVISLKDSDNNKLKILNSQQDSQLNIYKSKAAKQNKFYTKEDRFGFNGQSYNYKQPLLEVCFDNKNNPIVSKELHSLIQDLLDLVVTDKSKKLVLICYQLPSQTDKHVGRNTGAPQNGLYNFPNYSHMFREYILDKFKFDNIKIETMTQTPNNSILNSGASLRKVQLQIWK
jgi:hypothetical protein